MIKEIISVMDDILKKLDEGTLGRIFIELKLLRTVIEYLDKLTEEERDIKLKELESVVSDN